MDAPAAMATVTAHAAAKATRSKEDVEGVVASPRAEVEVGAVEIVHVPGQRLATAATPRGAVPRI